MLAQSPQVLKLISFVLKYQAKINYLKNKSEHSPFDKITHFRA